MASPTGRSRIFRIVEQIVFAVIVWAVLCGRASAQSENSTTSDRPFKPRVLMSPRKAIVDAPFLAAELVKDQVSDSELVLGVVIEGHARAYPINMLTGPAREIINDRLGETDFAATW
jgi:hypothetical protein